MFKNSYLFIVSVLIELAMIKTLAKIEDPIGV